MDVSARAEELAKGVAVELGLEVLFVEYQPDGDRAILRVYIDRPGGVDLGDCQRLSRQLDVLLEVEDFVNQNYVLEVSSPGIERPLFKEEDYERFQGREIRLRTTEKIGDRRNFKGLLKRYSKGIVTIDCDGESHLIPFDKIRKANIVHNFDK